MVCEENKQTNSVTPIHELCASALLHRIAHWDGGSLTEISQVLNSAFKAQDYHDRINDLNGQNIDPQLYINNLDKVSSCSDPGANYLAHKGW